MPIPDFTGVAVLVTGGAGFIGSHLVDALLERQAEVRVLDNLSTGALANLAHVQNKITFMKGDIRDLALCERAAEGAAYVFHQAALGSVPRSIEDPLTTLDVNMSGTATVMLAAHRGGAKRFVYASSSSVFGDSQTLPKREGEEGEVLSPYALSKQMDESLASVFHRCYGLAAIGLRYFNIYGPRQSSVGPYAAVIPRFMAACRDGSSPIIHGDGEQSRDFTFVKDAVMANLLAAGAPDEAVAAGYNIGASAQTTVNELARTIIEVAGATVTPAHEPPRAGDVRHSHADTSSARDMFGFQASTPLAEGLSLTWDAFVSQA